MPGTVMDYRDPVTVIDETLDNLGYLVDWLLEDIDVGILSSDLLAKDAIRSLAALRAIRALMPRLRIVRSNFESPPFLPDAVRPPPHRAMDEFIEQSRAQLRKLISQRRGGGSVTPTSENHQSPQVRAAIAMSLYERRMGLRPHE